MVLGAGVLIHTGSGGIQLASGGYLTFEDKDAAIFSAGRSGGYDSFPAELLAYGFPGVYPVRGGDVGLKVEGEIVGAGNEFTVLGGGGMNITAGGNVEGGIFLDNGLLFLGDRKDSCEKGQ